MALAALLKRGRTGADGRRGRRSRFSERPPPSDGVPTGRDAYELALARAALCTAIPRSPSAGCAGHQRGPGRYRAGYRRPTAEQRSTICPPTDGARARVANRPALVWPGRRDVDRDEFVAPPVGGPHRERAPRDRRSATESWKPSKRDPVVDAAVQWHPEELTRTPEDWDRRFRRATPSARAGEIRRPPRSGRLPQPEQQIPRARDIGARRMTSYDRRQRASSRTCV
jgi:hypothetical protein